ncbi:MAG TPA: YbfB/YjiJ family MFS transporter, partial [Candidatus Sumerlaeia bacterium]|nr:YbfB/YjiJ family MFS transporter [Candidatus Sumerlaeia bacterium]
ASSMIFGITAWSIPAIMAAACGDHLGSRLVPAALGFITLFFGIAQALGPWAAGMMADAYSSFSPALVAAAIIAWLGAADSLFLSAPK